MPTDLPKIENYSSEAIQQHVGRLMSEFDTDLKGVSTEPQWKEVRDKWLSRSNGVLSALNEQWLRAAPPEHKKMVGLQLNAMKAYVTDQLEDRKKVVELGIVLLQNPKDAALLEDVLSGRQSARVRESERLDITLPGIRRPLGAEHPVVKTTNEIIGIFAKMGYSVETGPEIETDYYNFESMNFPPNHPARDTQDTIFIAGQESKPQRDRLLLRTHTSPVQTRAMEKHRPPIRIVAPGKVHRSDTPDASHSPIFHQVEGLAVDNNITFSDLKGTLDHAMKELFGSDVKTRFFPSFFPFTEPSADVQVSCFKCGGSGRIGDQPCRLCKASGWIELLGCGMVDPKVLAFHKDNGYDPEKVSGFAFGMGVERIAMLKYGIDDIQLFFHGDVRFLEQFA